MAKDSPMGKANKIAILISHHAGQVKKPMAASKPHNCPMCGQPMVEGSTQEEGMESKKEAKSEGDY